MDACGKLANVGVDYKKNALNTLKILAAIQVAYVHIINHLEIESIKFLEPIMSAFMGVPIFFVLSGFLIWNSIGRSNNFKEYAIKRATRIFPELWLGVFVEIVLILILLKEKIDWLFLAIFTFGQSTIFQFYTPQFLRSYGCGIPNGSLWTMGLTIQFYFVVWFVFKLMNKRSIKTWIAVLAVCIAIKAVSPYISQTLPGVLGKLYGQTLFSYMWMFMFGAFLANYKEQTIPFFKKYWWVLLILSFVFAYAKFDIDREHYGVVTYLLRTAGFIGLCYNIPKLNIKFDISYGLFIYHMIVVNLMIEFGFVGKTYYLIIALAISIVLASLSTLFGKFVADKLNKKIN